MKKFFVIFLMFLFFLPIKAEAQPGEMSVLVLQKSDWNEITFTPYVLETDVKMNHGVIGVEYLSSKFARSTGFTIPAGVSFSISGTVSCWNKVYSFCYIVLKSKLMESGYLLGKAEIYQGTKVISIDYEIPEIVYDETWWIEIVQTGGEPWVGPSSIAIYGE